MSACRLCGQEIPLLKACFLCGRRGIGQFRPMHDGRWLCRSDLACQRRIRANQKSADR